MSVLSPMIEICGTIGTKSKETPRRDQVSQRAVFGHGPLVEVSLKERGIFSKHQYAVRIAVEPFAQRWWQGSYKRVRSVIEMKIRCALLLQRGTRVSSSRKVREDGPKISRPRAIMPPFQFFKLCRTLSSSMGSLRGICSSEMMSQSVGTGRSTPRETYFQMRTGLKARSSRANHRYGLDCVNVH
jgi:hypothetical protein